MPRSSTKVVALFPNGAPARAPNQQTAPKGAAAPSEGLAPVTSIFSAEAAQRRHFAALEEIVAAKIVHGRMYLEFYVNGHVPDEYFRTLGCEVDDPQVGVNSYILFEAVAKRNRHSVMVRSTPLRWAPDGAYDLITSGATVRVTAKGGRMIQKPLKPLLNAMP